MHAVFNEKTKTYKLIDRGAHLEFSIPGKKINNKREIFWLIIISFGHFLRILFFYAVLNSSISAIILNNSRSLIDFFVAFLGIVVILSDAITILSVVFSLLWPLTGQEKLVVCQGDINVIRSMFGIGLSKRINLLTVKSLKLSDDFPLSFSFQTKFFNKNYPRKHWFFWDGWIEIEYNNKKFSLGADLEPQDANEIIETITSKFQDKFDSEAILN